MIVTEITSEEHKRTYEVLSQKYEAEFSAITGKAPDSQGLYEITAINEEYRGFLVLSANEPVGFMVIHQIGTYRDVSEF